MAAIGIKKKKKGEEGGGEPQLDEEGLPIEGSEGGGKKAKVKKGGGGDKSKMITVVLIIVLVAVALFAGGVVMTQVLMPRIIAQITEQMGNTPSQATNDPIMVEDTAEELELVKTEVLEEMTIQLAPNQNNVRGMCVAKIGIGFTNEKEAAKFKEKTMEIEDIILSTISAKTHEELQSNTDQDAMRKVLAGKIAKLFSEKNQIKVMFGKFLVVVN